MDYWLIEKPTDPLKCKFKKCVLKFYPKELKDNPDNAFEKLMEVKKFPGITYFRYWFDYCPKLNHIHFNILLKSTQYKKLLEHYTNKGIEKDRTCHLYMEDIPSTDRFIDFIEYCSFRERTNWYNYKQSEKYKVVFDTTDEIEVS